MKSLKHFIIEKKSTDKEREEFFKKNDELSDSDPDAYKDAPGDEEARKAGKVKKSKHTKNYHDLYSDDEKVDEAEKASDKNNKENQMIISTGEVIDNKSIPPAGGCVVAPMVKLDNVSETLDYPGFHQVFFYGDHKKELRAYCRLFGIKPVVV